MAREFRIDVRRIWRELVAELVLKYQPLVRALVLPAILMAVADWVVIESTGAVMLVFSAIYWIFAAMFAVSTHRVVLLSPASLSNPWGVYVDRFVLRYVGYSFLIGFAMGFPIIGATLVFAFMGAALTGVVAALLMVTLWLILIYLMARLGMVLPAQAIGDRFDLVEIFKMTAGNGWRLVLATILPLLAAAIGLYPLALMAGKMPVWLAVLPMALNMLLTSLIGVAVLSCAYRELKRAPDFPATSVE